MTTDVRDSQALDPQLIQLRGEIRELAARLAKAERALGRDRRRWALAAMTATVVVAGGTAQLASRLPRLEVVGPNNDPRVAISVNPDNGSAGLEVFGLNGRRVIFLGTSAEGTPNLALYDPAGQMGPYADITLTIGTPNLALYDPAGQAIVRSFTP